MTCPPPTHLAEKQEDLFQKFLLRLEANIKLPPTAVVAPDKTHAVGMVIDAPPKTTSVQPLQQRSRQRTQTRARFGMGPPVRVAKEKPQQPTLAKSTTATSAPTPSSSGSTGSALPSEDTTQVFFGRVSTTERRAQHRVDSQGAVAAAPIRRPGATTSLVREREVTSVAVHVAVVVSPPPSSATKRQRVTPVMREDDTATANTIVTFKKPDLDDTTTANTIVTFKKPDPVLPVAPLSRHQSPTVDEVTESTVVSFKNNKSAAAVATTPMAAHRVSPAAVTPMAAVSAPERQRSERPSVCVDGVWYQKLSQIGKGGSSKVYKVINPNGEILALKEIDLARADESAIRGYENEIELLQTLQGSAYIITLAGWERKANPAVLLIVMECGDADLSTALKNRKSSGKAIDENYQRLSWQQMLEAVQAIHAVSIVHSDLKPANFLFVKGVLKLIDFGIATQVEEDHTSALRDTAVGTLNYMAPEAISNQAALPVPGSAKQSLKITPAADVWSLGCILYLLAFGKTPFQHLNPLQKLQAIVSPNFQIEYPKTKNRALIDVLKKCLVRDPKQRPSISELLEHKFLNPQTAQTPVRKMSSRPDKVEISREQLEALFREHTAGGGMESPGAMSRRVMLKFEANHGAVSKPSRLELVEESPGRSTQAPPKRHAQQSRPPLAQMFNPNKLTSGRQALKAVDPTELKRTDGRGKLQQPPEAGIASFIQSGLQNKFMNSAPPDQDTATVDSTEWPTTTMSTTAMS
jgi:serine/threonine protein kinase